MDQLNFRVQPAAGETASIAHGNRVQNYHAVAMAVLALLSVGAGLFLAYQGYAYLEFCPPLAAGFVLGVIAIVLKSRVINVARLHDKVLSDQQDAVKNLTDHQFNALVDSAFKKDGSVDVELLKKLAADNRLNPVALFNRLNDADAKTFLEGLKNDKHVQHVSTLIGAKKLTVDGLKLVLTDEITPALSEAALRVVEDVVKNPYNTELVSQILKHEKFNVVGFFPENEQDANQFLTALKDVSYTKHLSTLIEAKKLTVDRMKQVLTDEITSTLSEGALGVVVDAVKGVRYHAEIVAMLLKHPQFNVVDFFEQIDGKCQTENGVVTHRKLFLNVLAANNHIAHTVKLMKSLLADDDENNPVPLLSQDEVKILESVFTDENVNALSIEDFQSLLKAIKGRNYNNKIAQHLIKCTQFNKIENAVLFDFYNSVENKDFLKLLVCEQKNHHLNELITAGCLDSTAMRIVLQEIAGVNADQQNIIKSCILQLYQNQDVKDMIDDINALLQKLQASEQHQVINLIANIRISRVAHNQEGARQSLDAIIKGLLERNKESLRNKIAIIKGSQNVDDTRSIARSGDDDDSGSVTSVESHQSIFTPVDADMTLALASYPNPFTIIQGLGLLDTLDKKVSRDANIQLIKTLLSQIRDEGLQQWYTVIGENTPKTGLVIKTVPNEFKGAFPDIKFVQAKSAQI